MQDFAAQQLSKKQMNDVKGGLALECYSNGQWIGYFVGETKEEIEAHVKKLYGEGYCN